MEHSHLPSTNIPDTVIPSDLVHALRVVTRHHERVTEDRYVELYEAAEDQTATVTPTMLNVAQEAMQVAQRLHAATFPQPKPAGTQKLETPWVSYMILNVVENTVDWTSGFGPDTEAKAKYAKEEYSDRVEMSLPIDHDGGALLPEEYLILVKNV